MQKAIEVATKGGYEFKICHLCGVMSCGCSRAQYLIDPKFFQALGKAEGWNECGNWEHTNKDFSCPECGDDMAYVNMHKFIDHLYEGKPIDEFFNQLLS